MKNKEVASTIFTAEIGHTVTNKLQVGAIKRIRNEQQKYGFNPAPIFQEGTGVPATLYSHNIRQGATQEEFSGSTDAKAVASEWDKIHLAPDLVAVVEKPRACQWCLIGEHVQ